MTCKPCPFCGSTRLQTWEGVRGTTVECNRCAASGPHACDEIDAIILWNMTPRLSPARLKMQRAVLRRVARQRKREEVEAKAARERIEAPKRKREREYATWASEREAWLRAPVDEDTIQ
jgi:hypothetical protein